MAPLRKFSGGSDMISGSGACREFRFGLAMPPLECTETSVRRRSHGNLRDPLLKRSLCASVVAASSITLGPRQPRRPAVRPSGPQPQGPLLPPMGMEALWPVMPPQRTPQPIEFANHFTFSKRTARDALQENRWMAPGDRRATCHGLWGKCGVVASSAPLPARNDGYWAGLFGNARSCEIMEDG